MSAIGIADGGTDASNKYSELGEALFNK